MWIFIKWISIEFYLCCDTVQTCRNTVPFLLKYSWWWGLGQLCEFNVWGIFHLNHCCAVWSIVSFIIIIYHIISHHITSHHITSRHVTPHHTTPYHISYLISLIYDIITYISYPGIILFMQPANERWRYIATSSLIGWKHTQNDIWYHIIYHILMGYN